MEVPGLPAYAQRLKEAGKVLKMGVTLTLPTHHIF
jgi:hypothetical protein